MPLSGIWERDRAMLFHLLYPLHDMWPVFNVFRYITFRTIYAAVTALSIILFFGPWFMRRMCAMKMGQVIREDGPARHRAKAGTPSMGGILIIVSILVATLLWADLRNLYVWISILILVGYGTIGLADDLLKIRKQNSIGLSGRWKLVWQIVFVLLAAWIIAAHGKWDTHLSIPFFKNFQPDLGIMYGVFALLVVVMLGLLLICPTALARPGMPLQNVSGGSCTSDPDEEDPDNPNGSKDGDDDNWDKPAIKGHMVAESYGGNSGVVTGVDSSSSEDVLSRMEVSLSIRLALLLQSWFVFSGLR